MSDDYDDYPLKLYVQEQHEPIEFELENMGRYHQIDSEGHLKKTLQRTTEKKSLQILEAAVGQQRTKVKWPAFIELGQTRGKLHMEEYRIVGLRVEG